METRILITTAISGGSLRALLEESLRQYGAERLAVGIERVAMDFPLPCPTGEGRTLSPRELAYLRRCSGAPVFFSEALCAKYFAYFGGGSLRFVLFDDEDTIRKKERLARELGIRNIFLLASPDFGKG